MSTARRKTRKSPKRQVSSAVSSRRPRGGDGPARVHFNQDCLLYAFDGEVPLRVVMPLFMAVLASFAHLRKPGTEWLLFGGSGEHWRGYTTWIALSYGAISCVGDVLKEVLPSDWQRESTELCNPARESDLLPMFRISDEDTEVLEGSVVSPEQVAVALSGEHLAGTMRPWVRED